MEEPWGIDRTYTVHIPYIYQAPTENGGKKFFSAEGDRRITQMITADFVDGTDGAEVGFGSSICGDGMVEQSAFWLMP